MADRIDALTTRKTTQRDLLIVGFLRDTGTEQRIKNLEILFSLILKLKSPTPLNHRKHNKPMNQNTRELQDRKTPYL